MSAALAAAAARDSPFIVIIIIIIIQCCRRARSSRPHTSSENFTLSSFSSYYSFSFSLYSLSTILFIFSSSFCFSIKNPLLFFFLYLHSEQQHHDNGNNLYTDSIYGILYNTSAFAQHMLHNPTALLIFYFPRSLPKHVL